MLIQVLTPVAGVCTDQVSLIHEVLINSNVMSAGMEMILKGKTGEALIDSLIREEKNTLNKTCKILLPTHLQASTSPV